MEMETSPPAVAKKLWNIVRVVFFMLKTGISKSKLMIDLHLMFKRGNKLAGKAIGNLMLHHLSSLGCRSNDALSFVSPREYEFSCSNSPANFYPFYAHKRKHHHHHHHSHHKNLSKSKYQYDDVTTVQAVQRMLEMLNNEAAAVEASPMVALPGFGFGRSPMVRPLRITDSPFPLKDEGDSREVDKNAEEFIKKVYKDLRLQNIKAALDSPYHNTWVR